MIPGGLPRQEPTVALLPAHRREVGRWDEANVHQASGQIPAAGQDGLQDLQPASMHVTSLPGKIERKRIERAEITERNHRANRHRALQRSSLVPPRTETQEAYLLREEVSCAKGMSSLPPCGFPCLCPHVVGRHHEEVVALGRRAGRLRDDLSNGIAKADQSNEARVVNANCKRHAGTDHPGLHVHQVPCLTCLAALASSRRSGGAKNNDLPCPSAAAMVRQGSVHRSTTEWIWRCRQRGAGGGCFNPDGQPLGRRGRSPIPCCRIK